MYQQLLAKVGVPALDVSGGIDIAGKGKDYGKNQQEDYVSHHYHTPSDEFNPKWTFEANLPSGVKTIVSSKSEGLHQFDELRIRWLALDPPVENQRDRQI